MVTTDVTGVDFSPLSQSVTWAAAKQMRRAGRQGEYGKPTAKAIREARPMGIWLTVGFGGFITLIIGIVALVKWAQDDDPYIGGIVTAFFAVLCVLIYFLGTLAGKIAWRRMARLINFGRANGFAVQPTAARRSLPGVIFHIRGAHAETTEMVSWKVRGHAVQAAHHQWFFTGGTHANSHEVRYLAVDLNTPMPQLGFEDGRRGIAPVDMDFGTDILADMTNLPERHRPRLVCGPDGRERARALFTDELIALLIQDGRSLNAEVAGGYLFVYYNGEGMLDEGFWRHKIAVADVVSRNCTELARTADQHERSGDLDGAD